MSFTRSSPRWSRVGSTLLLALASKATTVYGATITVQAGGKIQDALNDAQPGDRIEIESGEYYEDIRTRVDGTADQRITITAAGGSDNRDNVIVRGGGNVRVFEVNHDYYTIESFTIDGQNLEADDDDHYEKVYRDKLLYVTGIREPSVRDEGHLSALDGLILSDMAIKNAGGECIRLRYFVTNAEIYDNSLENCGLYDFTFDAGGKNGEGIYIGTSNNQWGDGKNPTDDPDVCMGNIIRDNSIRTEGNEGVEVKEGSVDNIVEDNDIYMQLDADSGVAAARCWWGRVPAAVGMVGLQNEQLGGINPKKTAMDPTYQNQYGIGSRGDRTIIRNNRIVDASGAGVRVGGALVDGYRYGVNNEVYGNTMEDCRAYGVKIMASPQAKICGNMIELPDGEDADDYAYSGGSYGDNYDPREDCDSGPTPTPPPPSPISPTPTVATPSPEGSETDDSETDDSEYVGCFGTDSDSPSVAFAYRDSDDLTNEDCIEHCRDNGSRYAGTYRGNRCGCAFTTHKVTRNGESTGCDRSCPGDESQVCGGQGAVSTWKV